MTPAVRAAALTRAFGADTAVDRLDLEIGEGELFGLIGPDGAGKTTTIRLLAAILDPTSGDAWVAGSHVVRDAEHIKELIGYMPQRFGLYEDLTVLENIRFFADLYEVPRAARAERIERLLGFSNLTEFKGRLAGALSGGMKQKLGLACSLIHRPRVLFLDEPTNGVDPVSRRDFWRLLYGLLKEGLTIFVSTSYLDEAERCTRIAMMHKGSLLSVDDPGHLRRAYPHRMFELWCSDARAASAAAMAHPGVADARLYGDRLHVAESAPGAAQALAQALSRGGIKVKSMRQVTPSLEDVFISRMGAANGAG